MLSPECKPPVTDLTDLPSASLKLTVDADKMVGELNHSLWANFAGGSTFRLTSYEYNQPFWELNRFSGAFQYTRIFGIFCDGIPYWMIEETKNLLQQGRLPVYPGFEQYSSAYYFGCMIYAEDEGGNSKYNYWHLDYVLDTLLSAGIKPVVQCGLMPEALAGGEKLRAKEGSLINTPKDYNKWRELIYQTVKHCIERYGADEVRSWYFVCWNEPDLANGAYFVQDNNSFSNYVKMYDYFADGAKAADAQVKVGGPSVALDSWFKPFLEHCVNGINQATGGKGAPIDVISWHRYNDGALSGVHEYLLNYNRAMMNTILQFPSLKDLPTLVTEWGRNLLKMEQGKLLENINPDDQYTSYEAAYLCQYIDGALTDINNHPSRFMRSGATTQITDLYRYLSISYGQHFVPMPILNAYLLLAKMGNEQVELIGSSIMDRVHGFAARTSDGTQILIYRFDEYDTKNNGKNEEIELTVKGLPAAWSEMRRYQIDRENSNAWSGYQITPSSWAWTIGYLSQMEENSRLKITEQTDHLETNEGQVTFRLSLPPNSISLVVIGEEATPVIIAPSPHIAQVLQEEAKYDSAKAKLDKGDIVGAKAGLEQLAANSFAVVTDKSSNNPYSFWGQEAMYALLDLAKTQNDYISADKIRVQLLSTTLTDVERFVLLNERLKYLETTSNKDELQAVSEELQSVRSRLEYYVNEAKWVNSCYEW
jgi:xylan 1,4-beta-xylosidase